MAYTPGCMCDSCVSTREWLMTQQYNKEYAWRGEDIYLMGVHPPNYPVPSVIGEVLYFPDEIIIQDCDEAADPRRCYALVHDEMLIINDEGVTTVDLPRIITDAPEDGIESPNRR